MSFIRSIYRSPEGGDAGAGAGAGAAADDKGAAAAAGAGADAAAAGAGDAGKGAAAGAGDAGKGGAGAGAAGDAGKGAGETLWPDDWRTKIAGDDPKKLKFLERYATPAEVANGLLSVNQRIGAGELRSVLPKNATAEQLTQWRTENGIPESADKYQLPAEIKIPEEDKPLIDNFLKSLHGANASNAVAAAAINAYYAEVEQRTTQRLQADAEFARTSEDALRAEWGGEFTLNRNLISALVDTAPEDVRDLIKGGRLANGDPLLSHPGSLRWLNSLAREINPPTALVPGATNPSMAIESEIKQIEGWMGAPKGSPDAKKYWDDVKVQERYRALLDGQAKTKAKA